MLNMLEPNKIKQPIQTLALMGISPWRLREVMFTSPIHTLCQFQAILMQPLNLAQKTFLINLYHAIEKLLKLTPSEHLIQKSIHAKQPPKLQNSQNPDESYLKIKLIFDPQIKTPTVRASSTPVIIDLPNINTCQNNPAIKAALWKMLKSHII